MVVVVVVGGSGEREDSRPPYLAGDWPSCRARAASIHPSIHPQTGRPGREQLQPTVLQLAALVAGGDVKRATEELLRGSQGGRSARLGGGEEGGAVRAERRVRVRLPTRERDQRPLPPQTPPA